MPVLNNDYLSIPNCTGAVNEPIETPSGFIHCEFHRNKEREWAFNELFFQHPKVKEAQRLLAEAIDDTAFRISSDQRVSLILHFQKTNEQG